MLAIYCRTSRDSQNPDQSTIDQQKKKGIEFALAHTLEYKIYVDEGISGYKISNDDDEDPFNNRPAFTNLINDIKSSKIDSVWVWEHSRLSRNQYASAYIFNIFEKYKITLYELEKELDLKDPQFQMMRQILDAIAQYERHLIVGRTTRGLHDAINKGKRAYSNIYGYQRIGKDTTGHTKWEPIESELNNLRLAYKMYLAGSTLSQIVVKLNDSKKAYNSNKLGNFMKHPDYSIKSKPSFKLWTC
jgi:DNA invertase Pin-like site-specific DNA recombinase